MRAAGVAAVLGRCARVLRAPRVHVLARQSHTAAAGALASRWLPVVVRAQAVNRRALHVSAPLQKIVSFPLADIGEGIAEVEVLEWFVKEGDSVEEFSKICQVQSDKATVDISSKFKGVVAKVYYKTNEVASVGAPLVDIEVDDAAYQTTPAVKPKAAAPAAPKQAVVTSANDSTDWSNSKVLMTPAVRRMLREFKLDPATIPASGKNNRLLKEDVMALLSKQGLSGDSAADAINASTSVASTDDLPLPAAAPITAVSSAASWIGEDRVEPVRGIRKAMIKSMTAALKVPHFGYSDEIQMDALMQLRDTLKTVAKSEGVRLSYMPFFIKAASLALKQYPVLNSSLSEDTTKLTYHASHNISLAMDTPQGLLVPSIKAVQTKSILDIARELNELQQLGQDNKLGQEHLSGGTFSLSNIGTVGGTYLSPVLVVPQVVIGAVGKVQRLPRFDEQDNVIPVNIMQVSWSADHRVIDGVTMAKFSNVWKEYLENPAAMLLHLK